MKRTLLASVAMLALLAAVPARECVLWHKERDYFLGIDGMCQPEIIAAFQRLGLGEFLH